MYKKNEIMKPFEFVIDNDKIRNVVDRLINKIKILDRTGMCVGSKVKFANKAIEQLFKSGDEFKEYKKDLRNIKRDFEDKIRNPKTYGHLYLYKSNTIVSEINKRYIKMFDEDVEFEIAPKINFLNAKYYDLMDKTNEEIIKTWDNETLVSFIEVLKNYKSAVEAEADICFKYCPNKTSMNCYDKIITNVNKNIKKMYMIGMNIVAI